MDLLKAGKIPSGGFIEAILQEQRVCGEWRQGSSARAGVELGFLLLAHSTQDRPHFR